MATIPAPSRLTLPLPAVGAIAGGGAVALVFLLLPAALLEGLVSASGLPAVLAAAEPPLGFTARIALGLLFGGAVAGFAWFGLRALAGDRPVDLSAWLPRPAAAAGEAPRPPLFAASELGTPFLEVKATPAAPPPEQPLPLDLDQPLAAYDPAALRATPLAAAEPVAPLVQAPPAPVAPPPQFTPVAALSAPRPQLIDPGDRFETFELTPLRRDPLPPSPVPARPPSLRVPPASSLRAATLRDPDPAPAAMVDPATEASVHDLLARLEHGLSARPAVPRSLDGTLGDLRRLATGRG